MLHKRNSKSFKSGITNLKRNRNNALSLLNLDMKFSDMFTLLSGMKAYLESIKSVLLLLLMAGFENKSCKSFSDILQLLLYIHHIDFLLYGHQSFLLAYSFFLYRLNTNFYWQNVLIIFASLVICNELLGRKIWKLTC